MVQHRKTSTSQSPEVYSPQAAAEAPPLQLTPAQKLDQLMEQVDSFEKVSDDKERLHLMKATLKDIFLPKEEELLRNLSHVEVLSQPLKQKLKLASSLLIAIHILENPDAPKEMTLSEVLLKYASYEANDIQTIAQSMQFFLRNPQHPSSKWIFNEWASIQEQAEDFSFAAEVISAEVGQGAGREPQNEREAKLKDRILKSYRSQPDWVKLSAAAAGLGLTAVFVNWLGKKLLKDEEGVNAVGAIGGVGAIAAAGTFLAGYVVENNEAYFRQHFQSGLPSYLRFAKKLYNLDFSDTPEDRIDEREDKMYELLAERFKVTKNDMRRVSKLTYNDFMINKVGTGPMKITLASDKQLRKLFALNFSEDFELIEGYETMTLGDIFEKGLKKGLFDHFDPTELGEEDRGIAVANRAQTAAEYVALKSGLDAQSIDIDEILDEKGQLSRLKEDIHDLKEFSNSLSGEYFIALESVFGPVFSSIEDLDDYPDMKAARSELEVLANNMGQADAELFAEMSREVQDLENFLIKFPNPNEWASTPFDETQTLLERYEELKAKTLEVQSMVYKAKNRANENYLASLDEDAKALNFNDLIEGSQFALQTVGGLYFPVYFSAKKIESSETNAGRAMWTLALAVPTMGSIRALRKTRPRTFSEVFFTASKGMWVEPVKFTFEHRYLGKMLLNVSDYRRAFALSADDLLRAFVRGDIDAEGIKHILNDVEEYGDLYQRFAIRKRTKQDLRAYVNKLKLLKENDDYFAVWRKFFDEGQALEDDAMNALKKFISDEHELKLIQSLRKSSVTQIAGRTIQKTEYVKGGVKVLLDDGTEVLLDDHKQLTLMQELFKQEAARRGFERSKMIMNQTLWKWAGRFATVMGVGFTLDMLFRLHQAETLDERRHIVAETGAILLSGVAAYLPAAATMKATASVFKKRPAVALAAGALTGIAIAFKLDEPIEDLINAYMADKPNASALTDEGVELIGTAVSAQGLVAQRKLVAKAVTKGLESKLAKEAAEAATKRAARVLQKTFFKRMAETISLQVAKKLAQTAGWSGIIGGGIFGGGALADGPSPVGDIVAGAVAAGFIALTAKDAVDLGILVWEAHILNEEIHKNGRFEKPISKIEIMGPPELVAQYNQLGDDLDWNLLYDRLLEDSPAAQFKVWREGDDGFGLWVVSAGEVDAFALYDAQLNRVAGMNSTDIDKLLDSKKTDEA